MSNVFWFFVSCICGGVVVVILYGLIFGWED